MLELVDLLGLKVVVLLLDREGEDIVELLAILSLAHLFLDLGRKVENIRIFKETVQNYLSWHVAAILLLGCHNSHRSSSPSPSCS